MIPPTDNEVTKSATDTTRFTVIEKDNVAGGVSSSNLLPTIDEDEKDKSFKQSKVVSPKTRNWQVRLQEWDKKWLLMPKLIYLFLNCSIYATHNYTAMYFYKMWKIQIYQFGAVSSLSAVMFIGALFWAHLADKTGRHKSILIACTALMGFFFCLLELNPFSKSGKTAPKIAYSAVMYGLSCFFMSSTFPLVDTQIFSILAADPTFTKEKFGRQRLWGSIGHALITFAVGLSIQIFGYIGMFVCLAVSCCAFIICVLIGIPADIKIIKGAGKHGHAPSQQASRPSLTGEGDVEQAAAGLEETRPRRWKLPPAIQVLINPHFFFLALVILAAGYVRSVMSNYLAFYMQTDMHQSEVMVATAIMFRTISEVTIYFYNKQLLHTLGLHWMLIIAQIAGLIRVFAYSILPADGNWFYLSFAIELLKGTSTACVISAGVRMANDIAPKGCANTAQAYISGVYSGLSQAIGGALGGWIIYMLPHHSVAAMFRITFYMGLGALIMCIIKYSIIDRAILLPSSSK